MKNRVLFAVAVLGFGVQMKAQATDDYRGRVGINTKNPGATLHIESGNSDMKGIIIPRVSANEMKVMTAKPAFGAEQNALTIFLTEEMPIGDQNGKLKNVKEAGYYYYSHPAGLWQALGASTNGGGNSGGTFYAQDGTLTDDADHIRTVTLPSEMKHVLFTREAGSTSTEPVILVDGKVKTTAVNLNSDQRLKRDIQPIALDNKLSKLRPVTYYWNEKGKQKGGDNTLQYGFIAQEVERLYPEMVSTDSEGLKSVNYIQLIPVLTRALQEERARNDAQEKKIEELTKAVQTLKRNR